MKDGSPEPCPDSGEPYSVASCDPVATKIEASYWDMALIQAIC
ncbi:MAG: hypothetical protein AAFW95_14565 [Cyanobacteria bacterium J06638_6]